MNSAIYRRSAGFTIVELLVVIVVIGILAAISLVSYSGISQRAIAVSLQSDLSGSAKILKLYYAEYGTYPQAMDGNNCPQLPVVSSKYCLKGSSGNTFTYCPTAPYSSFMLKNTNAKGAAFLVTDSTAPFAAGSSSAVFSSGGTVSTSGCIRTHTFGTSCTTGSPCSITATSSGTLSIRIDGAGGGGGGGSYYCNGTSGLSGGYSSIGIGSMILRADGGTGGTNCSVNGTPGAANITNGGVFVNATNPSTAAGSPGGSGSTDVYCPQCEPTDGGNGAAGGRITGNLSISSGQIVNIIVGAGGAGGAGADTVPNGDGGTNGTVVISYPN